MKKFNLLTSAAIAAVVLTSTGSASAQQLEQAMQVAQRTTAAGAASQDRVEQLDDKRGEISREYRAFLQQLESVRLFVDQQNVFLRSQQNEIDSLQDQIGRVGDLQRELLPMMREMIVNLENFVALDVPFRMDERQDRLDTLRSVMDDPGISDAERYRLIVNAYEIETSYGRQLDAYQAKLGEGADAPTVDYLRIGRVSLIYLNPIDNTLGIWNKAAGQWDSLPGSYRLDVQKAIRIANEAAPPSIFMGPVHAATSAQ